MKLSEFIGGLSIGFSIYFITLGAFFLPKIMELFEIKPGVPAGNTYIELFFPYIIASVAAIGFGLRSDDSPYGGFSFGEQWPTLIGAVTLAGSIGICILLWLSGTKLLM